MADELAIPSALQLLDRQVSEGGGQADLAMPLRALQLRGLSKLDLTVHVERLRAVNETGDDDHTFEETCLRALELIHGEGGERSLIWDAAHAAAALLPRCLTAQDLGATLHWALEPSDLLPPRAPIAISDQDAIAEALTTTVDGLVQAFRFYPQRAEFIRAPRNAFTTRRAAVLPMGDRMLLEALASQVETELEAGLPGEVVWPRSRSASGSSSYREQVLAWGSAYIVKADISHFYESVDHTLLGVFLATHARLSSTSARAISSLLTSAMGLDRGLPEGPPASDILASAYLMPLDQRLAHEVPTYLRYADDFFFPANSVGEGRAVLQRLESMLSELGLALNPSKTAVLRHATFKEGLTRPAVREIKRKVIQDQFEQLETEESGEDAAELLESTGLDDETIWGVLYHHTISLDEAIDVLVSDESSVANAYKLYFEAIAESLRNQTDHLDLTAVSSLALECLTILSRTDVALANNDLATVQTWFPHLTPPLVEFLTHGRADSPTSAEFIMDRLTAPSDIDWVDAWMCHAAGRLSEGQHPADTLQRIAAATGAGPLTRVEAIRSLARHGHIEKDEWFRTMANLTAPLKSEMLFAGLSERENYTWLADFARESGDEAIAGALEASDSPDPSDGP